MRSNDEPLQLWVLTRFDYVTNSNILSRIFAKIRAAKHWEQIVASDFFFTIEVWTTTGLKRFMVLFFMELSTRRVEIAGVASKANRL